MIVRSSPTDDLDRVDQAWFESDAASNDAAIRDIDAEAGRHGLIRVNEYWLQTRRLPTGQVVRRGFCYRPPPDDDVAARMADRRGAGPVGASSADVVRQLRDA